MKSTHQYGSAETKDPHDGSLSLEGDCPSPKKLGKGHPMKVMEDSMKNLDLQAPNLLTTDLEHSLDLQPSLRKHYLHSLR